MSTEKVSVILNTFNRQSSAIRTLRSILAQSYQNLEVVVVEDGCESCLRQYCSEFACTTGREVRYSNLGMPRGLAFSRNVGVTMADGDYIAFCDDDDVWISSKIERQIELLQRKRHSEARADKIGAIYCENFMSIIGDSRGIVHVPAINDGNLRESIVRFGIHTVSSSMLIPRSVLEVVGGFDENLKSCIDHDFWMKLAVNNYSVYPVRDALVVVPTLQGRDSMMTRTMQRLAGIDQYVNKWRGTYEEWWPNGRGAVEIENYRSRVIESLATSKLIDFSLMPAVLCILDLRTRGRSRWRLISSIVKIGFRALLVHVFGRSELHRWRALSIETKRRITNA
ncbi:MAG: glycosyltransferase family 2 protein [Opitutaceae bacterium]|nr:glycosyltransferase family 2 protein [Opitutaceae bacterium]